MTKEQLIEAMALMGLTEITDYTIGDDYASIEMVAIPQEPTEEEPNPPDIIPNKPSEEKLQNVYDVEQERLRKLAVQARIDALTDLDIIVAEYIANSGQSIEADDAINTGLLKTVNKLESAEWHMTNVPKPTIDQLEALQAAATAKRAQLETNAANEQFLAETDWKVLRHIREQHLGLTTSMTDAEFDALENERQTKAKAIVR